MNTFFSHKVQSEDVKAEELADRLVVFFNLCWWEAAVLRARQIAYWRLLSIAFAKR